MSGLLNSTNATNNFTNFTTDSKKFEYKESFNVPLAFEILNGFLGFSIIASVLLNGIIVVTYFYHSHLQNGFTALIASLCLSEVFLAAFGMTGIFMRGLYGYFPLSPAACSFFLYCNDVFGSCVRYGHILIALNRLWAVTYPAHYRRHNQNLKAVYLTVFLVWLFLNALHMVVVIPGRIWPKPIDSLCTNNVEFQRKAALAVEILGMTITEVIVVGVSLAVWAKLWRRSRWKVQRIGIRHNSNTANSTKQESAPDHNNDTNPAQEQDEAQRASNTLESEQAQPLSVPENGKKTKRHRSHNRALLYLVVAVIICWTPNHVYWLLVDAAGYWNTLFMIVQFFMYYLNSWINPLLCLAALKEFRKAIKKTLTCS
ncbi:octopamine receptor beta-2R-like [Paramacrobiotus metropolitanus]|uniref:octopamine receptor beta-2R-like n=1 Tax=Paramacrobiotus metropolitanus TaxID=2943436 RepID=UPI0024464148|nr:octopamine receptor beta-2R-like [Paramacrobiotus metropolitanus]